MFTLLSFTKIYEYATRAFQDLGRGFISFLVCDTIVDPQFFQGSFVLLVICRLYLGWSMPSTAQGAKKLAFSQRLRHMTFLAPPPQILAIGPASTFKSRQVLVRWPAAMQTAAWKDTQPTLTQGRGLICQASSGDTSFDWNRSRGMQPKLLFGFPKNKWVRQGLQN